MLPKPHTASSSLFALLLVVGLGGCIDGELNGDPEGDSSSDTARSDTREPPASDTEPADPPQDTRAADSRGDTPSSPDTQTKDSGETDPCRGVTCSDVGTCVASGAGARCECPDGYRAEGQTCVAEGPTDCSEVTCSGKCSMCEVVNGVAKCTCPDGYRVEGGECKIEGDPCADVTCESGETCVPGHHCQVDPVCVPTCDCSNCGTCDASDFSGYTAYCGNPDGSPATKECNDPCPSGMGCIPYRQPICWPGQGCFSK